MVTKDQSQAWFKQRVRLPFPSSPAGDDADERMNSSMVSSLAESERGETSSLHWQVVYEKGDESIGWSYDRYMQSHIVPPLSCPIKSPILDEPGNKGEFLISRELEPE